MEREKIEMRGGKDMKLKKKKKKVSNRLPKDVRGEVRGGGKGKNRVGETRAGELVCNLGVQREKGQ